MKSNNAASIAISSVNLQTTDPHLCQHCTLKNKIETATNKGCSEVVHDNCIYYDFYVKAHKTTIPIQDSITVRHSGKNIITVLTADIIHLKGKGHYAGFFMNNNVATTYTGSLVFYEGKLDYDPSFLRINRTHIININYINRTTSIINGYVIMTNGDKLELSNKFKKAFFTIIESWNN